MNDYVGQTVHGYHNGRRASVLILSYHPPVLPAPHWANVQAVYLCCLKNADGKTIATSYVPAALVEREYSAVVKHAA